MLYNPLCFLYLWIKIMRYGEESQFGNIYRPTDENNRGEGQRIAKKDESQLRSMVIPERHQQSKPEQS